jgi:hypothetical protein
MSNTPWLTRKEAAEYLKLSVATLNQYASNGTGPVFYRIGSPSKHGSVRYKQSDLDNFILSFKGMVPTTASEDAVKKPDAYLWHELGDIITAHSRTKGLVTRVSLEKPILVPDGKITPLFRE